MVEWMRELARDLSDARARVFTRIEDAWSDVENAADLLQAAAKHQGDVHALSGLGPDEDRYGAIEGLAHNARLLADALVRMLNEISKA